ncbi:glycosyltransferase [Desulfitobacterium metallireducens]|nr:glycosyltransferase [Desulfitobacterium metallireducens]
MKSQKTIRVNSAVIIPALNPILALTDFVRALLERGVPKVIVVNDGSDSSYNPIFHEIEQMEHCTVLVHEVNRGKGKALKTAFTYIIEHYSYLDGVVTADADGQHTVEDVCKIAERLSLKENSLVLGVRNFKESNVPLRSYMGNLMTGFLFQSLYGYNLQDTQTGLRGIPIRELIWMVETSGERYDYEINVLIKARHHKVSFSTVPIQTVYFDNNSGSHFSTVRDAIPIFLRLSSGLIQYSGATIVTGFIDIAGFFVLNSIILANLSAPVRILLSTGIARFMSSILNFFMNRRIIFADKGKLVSSAVRYYIWAIILMIISSSLVYTISLFWGINESIIKLIIDIALGFLSYQVQLRWVFRDTESIDANDYFSR